MKKTILIISLILCASYSTSAQQLPYFDLNGMSLSATLSYNDIEAVFGVPDSYELQTAESVTEEYEYNAGLFLRLYDSMIETVSVESNLYAFFTSLPCGGLRVGDPVSKLAQNNIPVKLVQSDVEYINGAYIIDDNYDDYFYIIHENGIITAFLYFFPM